MGNRVKAALPRLLASTLRPEVLGKIGGFGGLFAFKQSKYRQPVLVASVDGVGTKLKLAFAMDRHDTIGQDLVNHCVNDIAVLGAEPLFFLDYLGTGKLEPRVFTDIRDKKQLDDPLKAALKNAVEEFAKDFAARKAAAA